MPTREFPLDSVLGPGASAGLELAGTTSLDVVRAVTGSDPMPTRPEGVLELGSIGLTVSTGDPLRFEAGAARVDIAFSAGVSAGLGIYDAPEPWGPWTTAYHADQWDVGPGETSSFPAKWISADGLTLHLVFSGDDCFSVRRATLRLRK